MPFYEYECQSCKFYTEVMQKITDAPLRKCPSCGKNQLKKLVSAPVFRLKGSGWYETDFKSEQERKRNLAVEREEPKPDTRPEKPAGAAEPATASTAPGSGAASPAVVKTPKSDRAPRAARGRAPAARVAAKTSRPAAASAARKPAASRAKPAASKARRKGRR